MALSKGQRKYCLTATADIIIFAKWIFWCCVAIWPKFPRNRFMHGICTITNPQSHSCLKFRDLDVRGKVDVLTHELLAFIVELLAFIVELLAFIVELLAFIVGATTKRQRVLLPRVGYPLHSPSNTTEDCFLLRQRPLSMLNPSS